MPPAHAVLSSPLHRIPTLWSLFRPLLRAARTAPLAPHHRAALEQHVRDGFRRGRRLGSVERARNKLGEAEQFLHYLESASHSSAHLDRLRALAAHLVLRRPPPPSSSPFPSRSPSLKLKPPFLSPSLLPSTPFAPPLARLRPQPRSTSLMIHRRRRASQRRFDLLERARDVVRLAEGEDEFERALGVGVRVRGGGGGGGEGRWGDEWRQWILDARASEAREQARNALVVPPALQHRAREAARERERRRGERAALRRRRERNVNLER